MAASASSLVDDTAANHGVNGALGTSGGTIVSGPITHPASGRISGRERIVASGHAAHRFVELHRPHLTGAVCTLPYDVRFQNSDLGDSMQSMFDDWMENDMMSPVLITTTNEDHALPALRNFEWGLRTQTVPFDQPHRDWRVAQYLDELRGAILAEEAVKNILMASLGRQFAESYHSVKLGARLPDLDGPERADYYRDLGLEMPVLCDDLLREYEAEALEA